MRAPLTQEEIRTGEVPIRHDFSFTAGVRMEVPRDFPGDVAFFPGSSIKMSQQQSSRHAVVILSTAESSSPVESWYREEMTGRGWRLTREAALDDRRYIRFEKEGSVVALTIDPDEGGTMVSMACTLGERGL